MLTFVAMRWLAWVALIIAELLFAIGAGGIGFGYVVLAGADWGGWEEGPAHASVEVREAEHQKLLAKAFPIGLEVGLLTVIAEGALTIIAISWAIHEKRKGAAAFRG